VKQVQPERIESRSTRGSRARRCRLVVAALPAAGLALLAACGSGAGGGSDPLSPGEELLVADFAVDVTTGAAPLAVTFTDQSEGAIDAWHWNFGDGTVGTAPDPVHVYDTPGTYTVTLTVSGPSGAQSITFDDLVVVVSADEPPEADFQAEPTDGAKPLLVQFTDLSVGAIDTWEWDFGDGFGSTERNPAHEYASAGSYDVSLTATGPGGVDIEIKLSHVLVSDLPGAPEANFAAFPKVGPAPLAIQFLDRTHGVVDSWSWDFGDGSTSNEEDPLHTFVSPGSYTIRLTVTGPGGTDVAIKRDAIEVTDGATPPSAEFTASTTSGAAPLQVAFADQSIGVVDSWSWNFGDGTSSTHSNPTHVYADPGVYTVSLTVSGPTGTNTDTQVDLIHVEGAPAPVANFGASPKNGTAPLAVSFWDLTSGSVNAWLWDFGDGGTSTAQNPSHTYTTAGVYTVRLTATGPGGSDIEVKANAIRVEETASPPVAAFTGSPVSGNAPLAVDFTNQTTGGATSYLWNFGDGTTGGATDPHHVYSSPGQYSVTLIASGPDGTDVEYKPQYVTVTSQALTANFNATPRQGASPLTVAYTDTSTGGASSWSWNFGDGSTSTQRHPTHVYAAPGDYTVTLTVGSGGASDAETKPAYVTVGSGASCDAGNARFNNPNILKLGYDFIPFNATDTLGCYVIYSAKQRPDGSPGIGNTAGIFVFELEGGELLVFGSGYGDPWGGPNSALFDAHHDVEQLNAVVEGCIGLPSAGTTLHFVAPHGHGDHINASFMRELRLAGYVISEISFHAGDGAAIGGMQNWTQQDRNQFVGWTGGNPCHTELASFDGVMGKIWFLKRSGHTTGSIDLVVDLNGNPGNRKLVRGSAPGGTCAANPSGTNLVIKAHGTAYVP